MGKIRLKEGTELFSVATGKVNPLLKASRMAVEYISSLEGFVAVHPTDKGTLWIFDSEYNAISARNLMQNKGIKCGDNICKFVVDARGIPWANVTSSDYRREAE